MGNDKVNAFLTLPSDGSGYGSGSGSGYGSGSGSGSGSGYGDGSGDGYGSGSGSGDGVKSVDGQAVHRIDGIQTILHAIHGNVAKGEILNADLTKSPCFVVKGGNCFAHGETLEQAMRDLESKIFQDMPIEEKIEKFMEAFQQGETYPVQAFYDWHNRLTGSCEMGRKAFAKQHQIDIENGTMTVDEFIALTKNAFGGSVIRQLEERVKQLEK